MELAEKFVRHSTRPGDLVVDPFACTGTHILAAAKLGRIGAGCEIDSENMEIAIKRGCDVN
jgi:site-specific DNA-methyltransferase (adenine-specific)